MKIKLSMALATISLFIGCGGSSSSSTSDTESTQEAVHLLKPQEGTQSYLFYGEVDPQSLGGITNVRVFSPQDSSTILVKNDNTTDVSYPVVSTKMTYNALDGNYSDMYVSHLSFVSNGVPYVVNMNKTSTPVAIQNSTATHLSDVDYEDIIYLGTTQYLTAHDDDTNQTVLITPDMGSTDKPINLGDREFLTVTYKSFGEPIDGYLLYNNETEKVEKCNLDVTSCVDILEAGSRDFEGDVAGDVYSAFLVDDKLYRVNKSTATAEEVSMEDKTILDAYGTTDFNDNSFYFIGEDYNLYRVNLQDKQLIKLTQEPDERIERIRSFTNDWVIYGSDTLLLASKKDGTSQEPTLLVENTQTKGYKYVTKYGVGDDFLFVTYSISSDANTTYRACIFDGVSIECKDNSFWAGATASKDGKLNFQSNYPYTPYAYVRVDDTDNFAGGTLKAIDPQYPLEDGLTMGSVPNYNFQTFLTNSRYFEETIDSEGSVVFYAKNDTNFHVDSFYMNLLQENSLKQLTDTEPVGITTGDEHCHGRHCMICHNLAGGKIYEDKNGTISAHGYRVKLEYEDGSTLLADVAKGAGENFSIPLDKVTKNFKPMVVDENGTVINSASDYNHYGVEYSDCNYCHARYGETLFDAPSAITIEQ